MRHCIWFHPFVVFILFGFWFDMAYISLNRIWSGFHATLYLISLFLVWHGLDLVKNGYDLVFMRHCIRSHCFLVFCLDFGLIWLRSHWIHGRKGFYYYYPSNQIGIQCTRDSIRCALFSDRAWSIFFLYCLF